jgi:hypothetical protein
MFKAVLRIWIRVGHFHFGKPDPDPHQSERPDPYPHQSEKEGAMEAFN